MSLWLQTCPSGSVKVCHTRSEMEFVTGETKPLHQTPISFLDLSWSPSSSIDLYKFNVTSWVVLESDGSLEPSASPAGLFSWTVDLSSGSIVSVSAGSFDHGSLLSFLHTSAQHYPHRDSESLTRLALTNAHEAASEMAYSLWTAIGGVWVKRYTQKAGVKGERNITWASENDLTSQFAKSLADAAKRLYREMESANTVDIRSKLGAAAPETKKRKKLLSSRVTKEKQTLQTYNEDLFRAILLRCASLPLSNLSNSYVSSKQAKKSKSFFSSFSSSSSSTTTTSSSSTSSIKSSDAIAAPEEEVDAKSGGFIRVAQLLSQGAPEAVVVNQAKSNMEVKAVLTEYGNPESVEVISKQMAQFSLCGPIRHVARMTCHGTWFLWQSNAYEVQAVISKAKSYIASKQSFHSEFSREWTATDELASTQTGKRAEWDKRASFVFSCLQAENASGLTKEDVNRVLRLTLSKNDVSAAEENACMSSMNSNAKGVVEQKEFEQWAKMRQAEFAKLENWRFIVEHLDGKNWSPKLFVVDLADLSGSLYSSKAIPTPYAPTTSMKKQLKGSFTWRSHRFILPGPVPNSLQFGKSPQDNAFVLRFNAEDFMYINRISRTLSTSAGMGSEASLNNQQLHALNMIDIAISALMSIGESA